MIVWSLSAVSCVAFPSIASAAPHPQERHGFWIGLGGGVGSAKACDNICVGTGRETAGVGYFKLGGTVSERLLIGGEFNLWMKEQKGVTVNHYNASATVTFYPQPSSGFFLKGGVGAAFSDSDVRMGSTTVTIDRGTGVGFLAGAGYDVRMGKNISITPAVDFWYGRRGNTSYGESALGGWNHNVVDFTIGVTFH